MIAQVDMIAEATPDRIVLDFATFIDMSYSVTFGGTSCANFRFRMTR